MSARKKICRRVRSHSRFIAGAEGRPARLFGRQGWMLGLLVFSLQFPAIIAKEISTSATADSSLEPALAAAGAPEREGAPWFGPVELEFFEKRIRPLLVERCYSCHSAESERLRGGLRLDSRAGVFRGGETGPAVVAGDPEKSLLIEAVRYGNPDLQMPPKSKLAEEEIAHLIEWVRMGLPWPNEAAGVEAGAGEVFDLAKRRQEHWSWQPIQPRPLPEVENDGWARTPVDRFILEKLEAHGLEPAPEAGKATLLRRLYFDLIGLPPGKEALDAFLRDHSEGAYEQVVESLLASPQFGERWGRHWLDLVRYAETLGHEFDYPIPNAWLYRDYVVRAFNDDVPYDRFVMEQIAGDLLPEPRRHPDEGFNESIIGTGFYWFGQQTHSPVDVRMNQAEVVENQIDVLTKTFLGLTVACARCHDHKFDAISTRDYYSLYGVISSSRYAQRAIEPEERFREKMRQLEELRRETRQELAAIWGGQAAEFSAYLSAAWRRIQASKEEQPAGAESPGEELDPERLQRWVQAMESATSREHPLFPWRENLSATALADWLVERRADQVVAEIAGAQSGATVFADFERDDYSEWFVDGQAFGKNPTPAGEWFWSRGNGGGVRLSTEAAAHSAIPGAHLQGALRSRTFTITNRFVHARVAGRESRINLFIDNFALIQNPIYGGLRQVLDHDGFRWVTFDLEMWQGHRAYLEFSDMTSRDLAGGGKQQGYAPDGYIAVSRILFSDRAAPPPLPRATGALFSLSAAEISSLDDLGRVYGTQTERAARMWSSGEGAGEAENLAATVWLDWLMEKGLLNAGADAGGESALAVYRQIDASIPDPIRAPAMVDGTGLDEKVFIRGNPRTLGEVAPRAFLEALVRNGAKPFQEGSGRLELARQMMDPANPFPARVMANRVWHHLFGRGLAAIPDDFGVLGQAPTHPELLDWLADCFSVEGEWSVKRLIRLLVNSSAYRMSSRPQNSEAEGLDPNNLWWHRAEVRRLEGEAIRDAILAVSGRLDATLAGPSVPVHLTEFMDGRGRPGRSGPLDGEGRRSLYIEVRRNFLSPMMRAFDAPVPFTTAGRRTISNVPAQSLILLNDPFVMEQARHWARLLLREKQTPEERIRKMYLAAFSRLPASWEIAEALEFLRQQSAAHGFAEGFEREEVWADLCHVIFNVKEFVFIN